MSDNKSFAPPVTPMLITYKRGGYYVDRPNYDGGEVVLKEDYDLLLALFNKQTQLANRAALIIGALRGVSDILGFDETDPDWTTRFWTKIIELDNRAPVKVEDIPPGFKLVPIEPTDEMCSAIEYGSASQICETRISDRRYFLRKAIAAAEGPVRKNSK